MSSPNNPFAPPEGQRKPVRGRLAWTIATLGMLAAVTLGLLWAGDKQRHEQRYQFLTHELQTVSDRLHATLSTLQTNSDHALSLTNQITSLTTRLSDLEKEKEQATQAARALEDQMREQLESRDVTISKLQGKLTVSIVDRVMFDSGEAILKPDGAAVMQKIADLLVAHPKLQIQVVGHTDNVPIRQNGRNRFASNWELSTARALAAVHFLTEKAGVDPARVGAAGYGEFRPLADNATSAGRAQNRRIAITILPEELTAMEPPASDIRPSTNTVPVTVSQVPAVQVN